MGIDEELQDRLLVAEAADDRAEKRLVEVRRLSKMPFHLRIQEKGMEENLESVYIVQKHTFEVICKRDNIHKDDWKDEFCLFWDSFLKGKCKSINEYLKRKNYG